MDRTHIAITLKVLQCLDVPKLKHFISLIFGKIWKSSCLLIIIHSTFWTIKFLHKWALKVCFTINFKDIQVRIQNREEENSLIQNTNCNWFICKLNWNENNQCFWHSKQSLFWITFLGIFVTNKPDLHWVANHFWPSRLCQN